MPVHRAAATPLPNTPPPAAALSGSESVMPVQRAAAEIESTPEKLAETDMPTMIMSVPQIAHLSTPAPSQAPPAAPVVGANQPGVQRQAEAVTHSPASRQPETSLPIQSPPAERLALEDVWPVQRKETNVVKAGDLPIDPVEVAEPMRHEKPEAAQIHQVMRQVAAAKTSDSSVELILPRRQRPTVPTPAVQRQPSLPARQTPTSPTEGSGGSRSDSPPQAYVPTEIGPLPGDLWEILGAPMPTPTAPAGQTGSPAVMRAAAAAESSVSLAEPPTSYPVQAPNAGTNGYTNGHTPVVQREVTSDTGPSQPSSVATVQSGMPTRTASAQEGGGQGAEAGEQGEVNVEELARQVYSEVKRRIAVDWERGRGRF